MNIICYIMNEVEGVSAVANDAVVGAVSHVSHHHNPMEQFAIKNIIEHDFNGLDLSFTNSALAMLIAVGVAIFLFWLGARKTQHKPSGMQIFSEGFYNFIVKLSVGNISHKKEAMKFVPFIFSVFVFILFCNLFGLLPYSFTPTSHIAVTFGLAILVFFTVVTIAIIKNGWHFVAMFVPKGVPLWLAPLMFVIELFSYLVKPCTLSVRLAANMIAGHTVLKVIAGFVAGMAIFGIIPVSFLVVLTGFEIFISCLQAYIFSLLTCLYINDALTH